MIQKGCILNRKLGREEAISVLEKYAGRLYDPKLTNSFVRLCSNFTFDEPDNPRLVTLDTRRLEPGMVIARHLHSDQGLLLLNEGKKLTKELIERLRRFEISEGSSYVVVVYLQDDASSAY